jgi:NAD-dependent deacetylase
MDISDTDNQAIDRVVNLLEQSRSLLFITGAGISADSGLPTYRGTGGLYDMSTYDMGTMEGRLPIEVLMSGWMMRSYPTLTWKYLAQIEGACRGARFNPAHEVIAALEAQFDRVWTLTQNIDGLHRQAGSRNVIDIHGDLHDLYCTGCGFRESVRDYSGLSIPPRCPDCAGPLRPDVVLFGELLPAHKLTQLDEEMGKGFDLVFTIGTTSAFAYVAEPVERARLMGVPTVEINPGTSEVSHLVSVKLAMGASRALTLIRNRYRCRFSAG